MYRHFTSTCLGEFRAARKLDIPAAQDVKPARGMGGISFVITPDVQDEHRAR
jgi:hypothetical protein